MIVHKLARFCS